MVRANLFRNNGDASEEEEKRIMHYSNLHKILLVGEGDFSFAACLAQALGSAVNIVATSLDSQVSLKLLYKRAGANMEILQGLGGTILHETLMFQDIATDDVAVGFFFRRHQELVRGFLKNAKSMLTRNGEIHVTHKTAYPFSKWEIEKLAEEDEELHLVEKAKFSDSDYPGYVNKRGDGS
ncbi:hypothetical protein BT93_F0047 [Corymbia citriodora subsp. variegata]|nr:hypothetical protein BT93_F0047 [Corymbia citriodora subsp. variegata]